MMLLVECETIVLGFYIDLVMCKKLVAGLQPYWTFTRRFYIYKE